MPAILMLWRITKFEGGLVSTGTFRFTRVTKQDPVSKINQPSSQPVNQPIKQINKIPKLLLLYVCVCMRACMRV